MIKSISKYSVSSVSKIQILSKSNYGILNPLSTNKTTEILFDNIVKSLYIINQKMILHNFINNY